MFEQLNNRFARIIKNIRGQGKITDENIANTLRDIRRALLEADVNFQVVKTFIGDVKDKVTGKEVFTSVTPGQQFIQILAKEMTAFLGSENDGIDFNSSGKTIILLAGLQGSGKTTTAVKLASFLKTKWQKSPCLIAADLQRPAAITQLQLLGDKIDVPVFSHESKNVIDVVNKGLVESIDYDVVIIDTAGRLHVNDGLMNELKKIEKISSPDEILFVVDGMSGQDAVNSSKVFNESLELSGIILTKMDGDSRGGAALSIKEVTGKPIKFMGIGENINDLEPFYPDRLANRILGMGDIVSLVEKAEEVFDKKNAERLQKKLENNTFTLVDFQSQLNQMKKMGSMADMLSMMPNAAKLGKISFDERQLKWTGAIINSMTVEERNYPDMISGSRRKRIALGSGRSVQEVNQLLKQFQMMRNMMKKIGKKGGMKIPFNFK